MLVGGTVDSEALHGKFPVWALPRSERQTRCRRIRKETMGGSPGLHAGEHTHSDGQASGRETRQSLIAWRWSSRRFSNGVAVNLRVGHFTEVPHDTRLSDPCHRNGCGCVCIDLFQDLRMVDPRAIMGPRFASATIEASSRLTRSRIIGSDRDGCCFTVQKCWLEIGWSCLRGSADFERDYFLLAPTNNDFVCQRQELRFDTAFALQKKLLSTLQPQPERMFTSCGRLSPLAVSCPARQQYWVSRLQTVVSSAVGRLSGSDRYARIERYRINNQQRAVIRQPGS